MVREGLKFLLASALDLDVVGEAENGREAVELVSTLSPDVVLMDLAMPVMDGAEATARIRDEAPCVQVVVLTGDGGSPLAERALEDGAISCLLKDARPDVLTQAVRDAADGKGSVDGVALEAIMDGRQSCPGGDLTRREREVLELLVDGLSNREIAAILGLSEGTVRQHVGSILAKLDAPNRTAARDPRGGAGPHLTRSGSPGNRAAPWSRSRSTRTGQRPCGPCPVDPGVARRSDSPRYSGAAVIRPGSQVLIHGTKMISSRKITIA